MSKKLKIGDVVYLNSNPESLFTVGADLFEKFPFLPYLKDNFYIIGFFKDKVGRAIMREYFFHQDCLTIKKM